MRRLLIAISILFLVAATPALADGPTAQNLGTSVGISAGELTPTPEMWFYEQYRHEYQDPRAAVRRKAEFRAAQRQARMAAMKWFGFSNQRPQASSDPWHGDWSSAWRSNNGTYPLQWSGIGRPWVIVSSP